jgi:hypothetical protein
VHDGRGRLHRNLPPPTSFFLLTHRSHDLDYLSVLSRALREIGEQFTDRAIAKRVKRPEGG